MHLKDYAFEKKYNFFYAGKTTRPLFQFSTLESSQKMVSFYNAKKSHVTQWMYSVTSCNICRHESFAAKLLPLVEVDKDMLEKIPEDMFSGPCNVKIRKALVDQTFFRNRKNWWKTTVGTDGTHICAYCMRQAKATGYIKIRTWTRSLASFDHFRAAREDHTPWKIDHSKFWRVSTQRAYCEKLMVVALLVFEGMATLSCYHMLISLLLLWRSFPNSHWSRNLARHTKIDSWTNCRNKLQN